MVSVCSGCDGYQAWSATVVSSVSGVVYLVVAHVAGRYHLDDPLDAFAVHAGSGSYALSTFF